MSAARRLRAKTKNTEDERPDGRSKRKKRPAMGQSHIESENYPQPASLVESRSLAMGEMGNPTDISQPIIEALYAEALVLADEARQVFDLNPVRETGEEADRTRMALSVEGLRTTTRVMHVLAWLLNHRAYFAGEISALQLRRHSKLPADRMSERENLALLEYPTRDLIHESEALHARVSRLDNAWRERFEMQPSAVHRLRDRLNRSFAQH